MKFKLLSATAMGLVAAVGWVSGANAQAMDECRDGVGETNNAPFDDTLECGDDAVAGAEGATSIGDGAIVQGENSTALGHQALASSAQSVAIGAIGGVGSDAEGSIAIGYDAFVTNNTDFSIAIGTSASVGGSQNLSDADGIGNFNLAIGYGATTLGDNATGLGANSTTAGVRSSSFGAEATVSGDGSTAIGSRAFVVGDNSLSFGHLAVVGIVPQSPGGVLAPVTNSLALGGDADGDGVGANAGHDNAIALGADSVTHAANTLSIGDADNGLIRRIMNVADGTLNTDAATVGQVRGAIADATNHVQVNSTLTGATASGSQAVAIGGMSNASSVGAIAIGSTSFAGTGNFATSLGYNAITLAENGLALGTEAYAEHEYSVALGAFSATTAANTVSVGDADTDYYRRIVNVEDGVDDNDAVTVGQLTAALAASGGSGGSTSPYLEVNSLGALPGAEGTDSITLGPRAATTTQSQESVAIGAGATVNAQNAIALGANSVTSADNTLSIGDVDNGLTRRIMNVADGTLDTDAATLGQVRAEISTAAIAANPYIDINSTGPVAMANGARSIAIGEDAGTTGIASIALGERAHSASQDAIAIGTISSSEGNGSIAVGHASTALGLNSIAVGSSAWTTTDNSNAISIGAFSQADAEGAIAIGSSFGDGARTIAGHENAIALGTGAQTSAANTASFGRAGDERRLTHIADGIDDTDAVTVGQLTAALAASGDSGGSAAAYMDINSIGALPSAEGSESMALGQRANTSVDSDRSVAIGADATVDAENAVALGSASVADRDNTVSVGSAGNERQITNVATGTADTDAVNVAQLDGEIATVNGRVSNNAQAITTLNTQFEQLDFRVDALTNHIRHVNHEIDENTAGIAIANALAGSTWLQANERMAFSANLGYFDGNSAIAFSGAARLSERFSANMALGTVPGNGDVGARAGVRFGW
ncbi:MAG: YadA-like family protein [Pseudomonadota bacterium]